MDNTKEDPSCVMLGVSRYENRDMIIIRIGDEVIECTPAYAAMVVAQLDGILGMFEDPEEVPIPGSEVPPTVQARMH